ncbi:hypothetical protein AKJ51_00320 [candidate division MSBL1 archaeon SCGC-AAA382A20]|uniref:Uncharacterized protein n=1 Tax=candidate division MSBL1 archaeon SCGC-AAA382A20 TaxID=1698280 RepID=A0A133VML8_9EURY|nr:hypothetical protein AKJ51_00320 [candidate division MSBL1 archaeon SCGC-AAA382A20]
MFRFLPFLAPVVGLALVIHHKTNCGSGTRIGKTGAGSLPSWGSTLPLHLLARGNLSVRFTKEAVIIADFRKLGYQA